MTQEEVDSHLESIVDIIKKHLDDADYDWVIELAQALKNLKEKVT